MEDPGVITEREIQIARVLRPLGRTPLRRDQALRAAQLLGVHWTTVYRLRARFLRDPRTSSLIADAGGRKGDTHRLTPELETVVSEVVERWMSQQRYLAHPILNTHMEIRRRCGELGLKPPSRNTVQRRVEAHRQAELALLSTRPEATIPPGRFGATWPLEIVQVDHTQADVLVIDRFTRKVIGRPWITLAIDLATRTVPAFFLGMERPSAATVALLVSRIVQVKRPWLDHLGLHIEWPMAGIPQRLHLDNAAEFRSRALRSGCAQYGIEIDYRPVGQPRYGGHIERMNRTLMERVKGLPGATGNSPRGRKARQPEKTASLTLLDFERWVALEIGERYHHSEHRGLYRGTPFGAWQHLSETRPVRQLPNRPDEILKLLINFMPMASRTIQADGLTIFYIRYWHPVFVVWREQRRRVRVRYHPEDLSRVYVSADGRNYVEARYADLKRPAITLWEHRAAVHALRANHEPSVSEERIFRGIGQQRELVARAQRQTARVRRDDRRPPATPATAPALSEGGVVDYDEPVDPYDVEIWQ